MSSSCWRKFESILCCLDFNEAISYKNSWIVKYGISYVLWITFIHTYASQSSHVYNLYTDIFFIWVIIIEKLWCPHFLHSIIQLIMSTIPLLGGLNCIFFNQNHYFGEVPSLHRNKEGTKVILVTLMHFKYHRNLPDDDFESKVKFPISKMAAATSPCKVKEQQTLKLSFCTLNSTNRQQK